MRFGRRGSVAVVPARGVFMDHEAGASGGILQMIVHAGAAPTTAAAARLIEADGLVAARQTAAERRERARREVAALALRRASAAALWAQALPLAGSLAERYLRQTRAIAAPLNGADLRFLPEAPVFPYDPHCRERRPAMVARLSDAGGRGIGAHLTYLRADGLGKAEMGSPRKVAGTRQGGFVHLAPGARVIVGEGLESSLAAWQARPPEPTDVGAVAAICAGGMAGLIWPVGTEALIIAPDCDKTGEGAAEALARRAWGAGLVVSFMRPPEGFKDWNDAARARRARP